MKTKLVELCLGGPFDGMLFSVPIGGTILRVPAGGDRRAMYVAAELTDNGNRVLTGSGEAHVFMFVGMVDQKMIVEGGKSGRAS